MNGVPGQTGSPAVGGDRAAGGADAARRGGSLARFVGAWRVSLRLARRDVAAHRARSILVAVLVGLPVLMMVAGLTVAETSKITPAEAIPGQMGAAQAAVVSRSDRQVRQSVDDSTFSTCAAPDGGVMQADGQWVGWSDDATPGMGCADDSPPAQTPPGVRGRADRAAIAASLQRLTGGRVVSTTRDDVTVRRGTEQNGVARLGVDGRDAVARGMVELTGGRWPAASGEVLVTPAGEDAGLPTSGQARTEGTDPVSSTYRAHDVTVVGTARVAPLREGAVPVGLVSLPQDGAPAASFLIARDTPFTWDDVRSLNSYGFVALSRAVVQSPPSAAPGALESPSSTSDVPLVVLFTLALLVESCLLAGPAFAVMAQRQRRTLALVAANGGTRAHVRRVVVAQAVVLGVVTACAGAVLGVAAAFAALPLARRLWPNSDVGPFDVPAGLVALVAASAVVASVVSALVPAAGLSRLDVVGALRRDPASPRVRKGQPVLGGVLAIGGGVTLSALVGWGASHPESDVSSLTAGILAAGIALVVGALLLVPALLVALGRSARTSPLPWRLALRDAARQRGRTVPSVAATMAGAILLAGSGIVLTAMDRQGRASYTPRGPLGSAIIEGVGVQPGGGDAALAHVKRAVAAAVPGARVDAVGIGNPWGGAPGTNARAVLFPRPGCTPAQTVPGESAGSLDCGVGAHGARNLIVVDPAFARSFYSLSEASAQALAAGRIVTTAAPVGGGDTVTAVQGVVHTTPDGSVTWTKQEGTRRVPVTVDPSLKGAGDQWGEAFSIAFISADTWRRLGGAIAWDRVFVMSPTGPITVEQESALKNALMPSSAGGVSVERGYQPPYAIVMAVLFCIVGLLIVVAAVIATTLAMGEARRDYVILGAIGAADSLRRRVAAAQAGVLALVGTLLGLAVGAVPGVALARAATGTYAPGAGHPGIVEVPWLAFLATVVLTPLVAAGCAALLVPARPDFTRRED